MLIKIKKSETADTRTCDWSKVTKEQLIISSEQHIADVQRGIIFLINKLSQIAKDHDKTKLFYIDDFYRNFKTGFNEDDWWKMHQKIERHHFNAPEAIQDDVNLLDVLEQIVDGVMAGLARSGEYRDEELPDGLLEKAYKNTIKLLLNNVTLE